MSDEHIKVLRSERDQWQLVLEHSPAEYGKEVERKIAALDAAIAALGGGWLPIESAPKGVYVLLGNPKWASPGCGAKEDGEWLDFGFAYDPPPTHWMPLPAPPSKEG